MHMHLMLHPDWKPIDQAALGLIYGAILVLSLLMALEETADAPSRPAIVLFGSVLSVTMAKAFSELLAHALQTRERILTPKAWAAAWEGSRATLAVANLPTLAILVAGLGWIDFAVAVAVSRGFCVAVLVALAARVGWAINPKSWLPLGGAAVAGGTGSALAALKYLIH
ncbi:hypothetical protein [Limnoraphis robusta]|uniref:MAPEG family protein n=1 Tax=Limnoraphis robusta CCNP1315 TaxID=3110306 RepID=A0ABU5U836_9CYAN|nr:hypothetical protein [Limnoraphis robusta]MEA5523351.1 hypothetical protein [Limnoraphis robusta CCNP1315]